MLLNYSIQGTEGSISSREVEKALHRETNSPQVHFSTYLIRSLNRLKSIYHDSQFVESISSHFPNFPLVGKPFNGRTDIQPTNGVGDGISLPLDAILRHISNRLMDTMETGRLVLDVLIWSSYEVL
jgi:hypothetical protein